MDDPAGAVFILLKDLRRTAERQPAHGFLWERF
jgi:hypothetical protein